MTVLMVRNCGPMTSLQDFGRFGWQRYGVASSGAMDRLALAAANTLVGNPPGTAGIEFILFGGEFTIEGASARVAIAGAPGAVMLDGEPARPMTSMLVHGGQTLAVGAAQAGVYTYLAVAGGFSLEPQLGSLSLHARAHIGGGFHGRPLQAGDRLPLNEPDAPNREELALDQLPLDADATIRVVLGPQDDHFTAAGVETFLSNPYRVSQEADRMGYRLAGARIEHGLGYNIVSDGIVAGSVQVPGTGEPIVMMADRQTTGGYPKIATVISPDLRVLAQRRPGASLRFRAVGMMEAQRLARDAAQALSDLTFQIRPAKAGLPDSERLLTLNLAGSAVDALETE